MILGPAGQREFLITALRAASARARLAANVFDTDGVSLRNPHDHLRRDHRLVAGGRPVGADRASTRHGEWRPVMSDDIMRQAAIEYRTERDKREAEAEKRDLRRHIEAASASQAAADAAMMVATRECPEASIDQVPAFSDDWIALTFTGRHAHDLRYCASGASGSTGTACAGVRMKRRNIRSYSQSLP